MKEKLFWDDSSEKIRAFKAIITSRVAGVLGWFLLSTILTHPVSSSLPFSKKELRAID